MIVKYLNGDVWGYIDNVNQVASKCLDCDEAVKEYDKTFGLTSDTECVEYMDGKKLPDSIVKSNKAFMYACEGFADEGINRHSQNLLHEDMMDCPAVSILLYLENCKEYDALLLVTNQKAFLMNDRGQTIERLN